MDKLFTFFSDVLFGWIDALSSSQVSQVFWFLLALVAAGGVLCAMLGKKSLVNRGLCGTLELTMLYLLAIALYSLFPYLRRFDVFPFLALTDAGIVLSSPVGMKFSVLAPELVRFLLLILAVNLADSLVVSGTNPVLWLCTQIASLFISLVLYIVVTTGIQFLAPPLLDRFAVLTLGGLALLVVVVFGLSIYTYQEMEAAAPPSFHRLLTRSRGGALMIVSMLTCLSALALLSILPKWQFAIWEYSLTVSFWLILLMLLTVLCIFSLLFHDRRKG